MREEPHVYYSRLVGVTGVGPWSPVPQGPEVRGQLNGNEDDFQYDGRSGKLAAHSKRKHPVDGGVEILPVRKASSEKIAMNRPVTIQRSGIQNAEAKCIPADNKGYQMLKNAGWKVGMGLGRLSNGRHHPLLPEYQSGRRGLGTATHVAAQVTPGVPKAVKPAKIKSESVRIALPEDGEDLDTKVKRHRQVMQSEVDDAARQKISRFVYNAFKDGGATGGGADNNPLLRRNKLSSTNPLL